MTLKRIYLSRRTYTLLIPLYLLQVCVHRGKAESSHYLHHRRYVKIIFTENNIEILTHTHTL